MLTEPDTVILTGPLKRTVTSGVLTKFVPVICRCVPPVVGPVAGSVVTTVGISVDEYEHTAKDHNARNATYRSTNTARSY